MMDLNNKIDNENNLEERAEEVGAMGTLTSECEFSHEEAEEFIDDVREIGIAGSTIGNHPIDVLNPIIPSASEDGEKSHLFKRDQDQDQNLKRDEEIEVCEIHKMNEDYNVDSSAIDSSYYDEDQPTIDYSTVILADDPQNTDNYITTNFVVTTLKDGTVVYNEFEANDESEESFKSFQERGSILVSDNEDADNEDAEHTEQILNPRTIRNSFTPRARDYAGVTRNE